MIDFAHSIYSSINDETSSGPHKDYLFGLERLIEVFREILNEE